MSEALHYTDQDFQSYFEGTLAADATAFKAHVQSCATCRENYEAYAAMWSFVAGIETETLPFDLADAVAAKVFGTTASAAHAKRQEQHFTEKGLHIMLISVALVCAALCIRALLMQSLSWPWLFLLLPVILYAGLLGKEIDAINSRWRRGLYDLHLE